MEPLNHKSKPIIRTLTPALQEKAINELNEVPDRLESDVLTLRQWVQSQSHLRARTDDQLLVSFLRSSKFKLEKAKGKIDRYYSLRAGLPEIFNEKRSVDDPLLFEIIRSGVILQLPLPEGDTGPAITMIRVAAYDTNKYKFADIVRVGTMFGEIMMMEDDNATVSGYKEIMDMSNISSAHFFQLQADLLRKLSSFAEAMPIRHGGIHFINVPAAFEMGFNTLRALFPAKMMTRITVNTDPEMIKSHIPLSILPKEYGGENGTLKDITDGMEEKILQYRDYFAEEKNFGSDEKLRENNQRFCYEKYFGIEGSFRKMDID